MVGVTDGTLNQTKKGEANMKKLVSRITIALFVTLYACYPVHAEDEGRYKGFHYEVTKNDEDTIFILDSKTGEVRYCFSYVRSDNSIRGECKTLKVKK